MNSSVRRLVLVLGIVLLFCLVSPAPWAEKARGAWKVEDVILQERAQEFDFSPDGKWLLWVKRVPDKEKDEAVRHVHLTSLAEGGKTIALTRGKDSEFSPKWSPSGVRIAFLSTRKIPAAGQGSEGSRTEDGAGGSQLWLMDFPGGEPEVLTRLEFGVRSFDWLSDDEVILVAREKRSLLEEERKKRKDTSYIVEDDEHMPPYRLFVLDIGTKKLRRLTTNIDQITDLYLSRDKRWVLTRHNRSLRYEVDKREKPKFFLTNLETGSSEELFPKPDFKPVMCAWDADSRGFYFSITRTSDYINEGPGAQFLYYFDLKSRSYREVDLHWDWGLFHLGFQVRPDGFVACLANGARPKWRRYWKTRGGYRFRDLKGEHASNIFALYLHPEKDIAVYQYSTASTPPVWYRGELRRSRLIGNEPIIKLNRHLEGKKLARTEVVRWIGALDEEVEGILYYPHDYVDGGRYPLVLMIHGGPTGVDMDAFRESWAAYPNLMAQRGAFVLRVNYHGSGGYGRKFAESLKGHYYEYELEDIRKGVEHLASLGLVDPERVAALGWSNGGILTIALSVWTDMIKVAGVGAADANWISDYGNCAFGVSFDNYYFKGPFWKELDHYLKKSPIFYLEDMTVPTIIFHGTEDTNVPYEQGWEYYRALQQIGKAPVRFVVFPGEPHSLRKLSHQERKMAEELRWFDTYFFGKESGKCEALREGTPLDLAIKKLGFPHVGPAYGINLSGKLVPEIVEAVVDGKSIGVGRFEVTRAQWAAFDTTYTYPCGTDNYPVSCVSFEDVKRYVEWLSSISGERYRLPTPEELDALAGGAPRGNVLDYWAGYTLNYDDSKELQELIERRDTLELLLPVDYFTPAAVEGGELLFGLSGNVAEWAVDENGDGKVVGKCAVSPADDGSTYEPPKRYVGFRVVKD